MCFFPWVMYKVTFLRPIRKRGSSTISLWRFLGSTDPWRFKQRAGDSTELHCDCDMVFATMGCSNNS